MAIASAPLFVMGIHDYTQFIKMPTYQVNQIDVYNEWTDANGTIHRDVYRTSTEGSFTLWFDDHDDYEQFISDINEFKTVQEGYILAEVYINNKLDSYRGYFYIDFTPANELPYMGSKAHEGFQVTIKER